MLSRNFIALFAFAWVGVCQGASILGSEAPPPEPYLGIRVRSLPSTTTTNEAVAGILVSAVDQTGPAAGQLRAQDVLRELNGQLLFNGAQLRSLLATLHAGDAVRTQIQRGDETLAITFPLGTVEAGMGIPLLEDDDAMKATPNQNGGDEPAISGSAAHMDELLLQIREVYEASLPEAVLETGQTEQFLEEVRKHIEGALEPPPSHPDAYRVRPVPVGPPIDDKAAATMHGEDSSITLSIRNGQRIYSYHDAEGNVVYEGSLENAEDRAKVPFEAWKMIYELESTKPPQR